MVNKMCSQYCSATFMVWCHIEIVCTLSILIGLLVFHAEFSVFEPDNVLKTGSPMKIIKSADRILSNSLVSLSLTNSVLHSEMRS